MFVFDVCIVHGFNISPLSFDSIQYCLVIVFWAVRAQFYFIFILLMVKGWQSNLYRLHRSCHGTTGGKWQITNTCNCITSLFQFVFLPSIQLKFSLHLIKV